MRKRLVGLFASTMIVFAACQGAASPSPSGRGPVDAAGVDRHGSVGSVRVGLGRRPSTST